MTSQKRKIKTSQKRKTSNKVFEKTIDQQQQPSLLPLDLNTARPSDRPSEKAVVVSPLHPTTNDILIHLLNLGVAKSTAKSLLRQQDEGRVYRWVTYTEQRLANGWVPQESPATWIVSAIRSGDWVIPSWFQTPEEQAATAAEKGKAAEDERTSREAQLEQERQEAEDQRRAVEAQLGVGERTRDTWERVKELLRERDEFSIAFHSAYLMPLNGRMATLATSIPFFREVIEKRADALCSVISEVSGREIEVVEVKLFQPTAGAGK